MNDPLLAALAAAVAAAPRDAELRVVYAERLISAGAEAEAIGQLTVALASAPDHRRAAELMAQLMAPRRDDPASEIDDAAVDWRQLEEEIGSPIGPPYLESIPIEAAAPGGAEFEIEREVVTLADVGGLDDVKQRIRSSFLAPMANPDIARAFKKTLRGGMLLYGPPGCGKTFIARAIAGELGASFLSVTIADVLTMWMGESEGNMHRAFQFARRNAPAVLFFDEIDALGGKRSMQTSSGMRNVVNQLLLEMDGADDTNDGVYVLAATNHPWDVDAALLRPGRFDRMILVLPPDAAARDAIIRLNLRDRPIESIDMARLAARTEDFSGADLAHLCTTAAEKAMMDSIRDGAVRPIQMRDFDAALREVKPSIGPWLESARNVASYGNADGRYDDLAAFLKLRKLL